MCSEAVWFVENISCQFEYGQVDNNTSIVKTGTSHLLLNFAQARDEDDNRGGEESDERKSPSFQALRGVF